MTLAAGKMTLGMAALMCVGNSPDGTVHIRVGLVDKDECAMTIDDRTFISSQPDRNGALLAYLKSRHGEAKTVHIDGTVETPWRCIGGTIYALQMGGFTHINFNSQPPEEQLKP